MKKWIKPELVVLVKTTSDENVLCICKNTSELSRSLNTCYHRDLETGITRPCNSLDCS